VTVPPPGRYAPDAFVRAAADGGDIVGRMDRDIAVFKGIRYAAPPIGALRWRPPQRLPRLTEPQFALAIGPSPIQELPLVASLMYRLNFADTRALVTSEDCLYLNVWSPELSAAAGLPVMVWVHGGANRVGHGGQELFEGHRLAARGVVVVTINMRLGSLGFLSLPELAQEDPDGASGNYGLHDAVAALGWVQENIRAFGGDPAAVTIVGNSAGAAIVNHLMAAPAARGLFRAAIGQSIAGIFRAEGRMTAHDAAADHGRASVASLGRSVAQLRGLSATAFLKIAPQGIVVDGGLLVEDTTDAFLGGRQAPVPLLVGWNEDEGSLFPTPAAADEMMPVAPTESAAALLERTYPSVADADGAAARRLLVGDRRFAYPVWRWARTHAKTSDAPTWLYKFDHRLPLPADLPPPPDGAEGYGTFHSAELPYMWDNLDVRPWAWSDDDRAVAHRLADSWTRFVSDCDPNGGDLPDWDRVDASKDIELMVLGSSPQVAPVPRRDVFELFDEQFCREMT